MAALKKRKSKYITDQKLLQLSCKPKKKQKKEKQKKTPISDQTKTDKKLETLGVQKETYLIPGLMLKELALVLCWWVEEE
jgi:hypothetical protein